MTNEKIAELLPHPESLINGKTDSEIVEMQVRLHVTTLRLNFKNRVLDVVTTAEFQHSKKRLKEAVGDTRAGEIMEELFAQEAKAPEPITVRPSSDDEEYHNGVMAW